MWRRLLVVGIALHLSACCFGGTAKITPVDPVLVSAVVMYLRKKRGWKFGKPARAEDVGVRDKTDEAQRLDRHRGMFARRRVEQIGGRNADLVAELQVPNWQAGTTPPRIVRRVEAELDATETYFHDKIGTTRVPGPLAGGPPDRQPPHLDLVDVGRTHVATSTASAQGRASGYLRLRKQRATAIIWGAAAHDEVWDASADRTSATMRRSAIDELVDRRLRAIERMAFQVSDVSQLGGRAWRESTITDGDGPWQDGFRIRPFEYARLIRGPEPVDKFVLAIGTQNIVPKGVDAKFVPLPGETTVRPWRWSPNNKRLEYNIPPVPGLHFPTRLAQDFRPPTYDEDHYLYSYVMRKRSGRSASAIIDDIFLLGVPDADREDFWQRMWVFCDHCVSSLLLEGLRFALLRRTGSDAEFDRILSDHDEGTVRLGPFAGRLLTSYFDLLGLPAETLEIGDHTIFWNSHLYLALTEGDWRLEHSLVMDIDADPESGRVRLEGLHFQGHGIEERSYRSYQRAILNHVTTALGEAQERATKVGLDPQRNAIEYGGRVRFVRWAPFEPFKAPGAWWVFVDPSMSQTQEILAGLVSNPLAIIPGRDLPPPQPPGFNPPPFDGLYFPLFKPRIKGGWQGYLAKRRVDPTFKPPNLEAIVVDESIIPGIYQHGSAQEQSPVVALRPKARR
jgi:hypothetical protein